MSKGSNQRPDDGKYADGWDRIFGKKLSKEWLERMAKMEDDNESISVGGLYHKLGFLDDKKDKNNEQPKQ